MFLARRTSSLLLQKQNIQAIHHISIRFYHEPIDFDRKAESFRLRKVGQDRGGGGENRGFRNHNNTNVRSMSRNDRSNKFDKRKDDGFEDYEVDPNAVQRRDPPEFDDFEKEPRAPRNDAFKGRSRNENNYKSFKPPMKSFSRYEEREQPPVEQQQEEEITERQDPISLSKSFHTILDIYRYAVSEFTKNELVFGQSSINVYDDAAFLILHELALPFDKPIDVWSNAKLLPSEKIHLLSAIKKRVQTRLPTAYLVNGCVQQGEYFYIDQRALIPRSFIGEIFKNMDQYFPKAKTMTTSTTTSFPLTSSASSVSSSVPTELGYEDYFGEITDEKKFHASSSSSSSSTQLLSKKQSFISPMKQFDPTKVRRILDLCTGSGCLAILAARFFPNVERIDAVDISEDALKVAEMNVKNKGLTNIIHLYQGDLFRALNHNSLQKTIDNTSGTISKNGRSHPVYDLIISNPPYVPKKTIAKLPKEFTHEPVLALDGGGHDGLNLVKRIFLESRDYLNPNQKSFVIVEIGSGKNKFQEYYEYELTKRQQILAQEAAEAAVESTNSEISGKLDEIPPITWISTSNSKEEVFFMERNQLPDPTFFIKRANKSNSNPSSSSSPSN